MKPQRLIDDEESMSSQSGWSATAFVRHERQSVKSVLFTMTAVIMLFVIVSIFMPPLLMALGYGIYQLQISPTVHLNDSSCEYLCSITLVESIPENLTYPQGAPSHTSTFDAWSEIIDGATTNIYIASFYWTLLGEDVYSDPSDWQGETILKKLVSAVKERNIKMRIVQNDTGDRGSNKDLDLLSRAGAEVRYLNMTQFFGAGVLHTKMILVDGQHLYIGSANMDWRSLTQVKELGALVRNCTCLVKDAMKLFEVYWMMANDQAHIPDKWPKELTTLYNKNSPMKLKLNGTSSLVYLSSSPLPFCPKGRTDDLSAILDIISKAKKFIYISVMDYSPSIFYSLPRRFWPDIDNALRRASLERGVNVRILGSLWDHTQLSMLKYLKSLSAINGAMRAHIQVRLFQVPVYTEAQAKIPFSRVNHNKYMVTDNTAYIGTSNWSGDYFVATTGVGLVVNETLKESDIAGVESLRNQLEAVFLRDWNSPYASRLNESLMQL